MVRSLVCVVLAVVGATAFPGLALAQSADLSGTYRCDGVSPSGKPYRTIVEIAKDDQTYVVRWRNQEGAAVGIGIVRNDVLAVSYFTGRDLGVVVYRIEKGPTLTGQWGIFGADGHLYPETLTRVGLEAHGGDDPGDTGSPVTGASRLNVDALHR